jgi:hypothetical protein
LLPVPAQTHGWRVGISGEGIAQIGPHSPSAVYRLARKTLPPAGAVCAADASFLAAALPLAVAPAVFAVVVFLGAVAFFLTMVVPELESDTVLPLLGPRPFFAAVTAPATAVVFFVRVPIAVVGRVGFWPARLAARDTARLSVPAAALLGFNGEAGRLA